MENQQLIKKDKSANSYSKIFPWTFTDLVLDRVTKESLDNILVRNNFIALPYVGSEAETRLQVPMKNRRKGIWLSYIDYAGTLTVEYYNDNNLDNNHWQDSSYWLPYNTAEFQPASVGLSALAQEVFDWINSQITTAVKLNPEDLQKNSSGQIEEANRAYDTSTFSGLGYRIVRKNIQNNKNVLTQSMINMPNNVYKIRYDFDLNGATINLPANSVLQFVGGSIKNGTLNGNNTAIEADSNAVIFDSVVIEGTWNVEHIYDSWFAFNPSPSYTSNQIITNILALSNDNVYNTIHFDADRTYYFELPYKGKANLGDDVRPDYWKLNTEEYAFLRIFTNFTSNTHLIVNNIIQMLPTNQGAYFIFHIEGKSNIEISGTGTINADAKDHLYTDPFTGTDYYGEWGHIFNFRSCDNIVIRDITVGYAFGDALAFSNIAYNNNGAKAAGPATKNVLIDGVKVLYARRNGIALGGNNYTITNVYFEGCGSDEIKGTAPMAGIDFENDYTEVEPSGVCSNVSMSSCKFKNNKYDVSSTIRDDLGPVPRGQLVTISDCNFTSPLRLNRTNGLTFNNCHIVGISNHDNSISPWFASKDLVFNSCVFDELNPYLTISAEEQNKKFINPTYPEDIKYSTTFQQSLAAGRALKFTIPKPLVGLVEFTAFCSNPNYSAIQMPINITEYSFGNNQRLTGIRDIKVKAAQDNTLRYASYKNVPVFSYINYLEDANNFNIYFAIGGDLISNPLGGNTSVNIFLTSKTKFIVVEAPVSENPKVAGMYGGKWSTLSAITKSVIDVTAIPSSVTFPSKEMFPANMLADLPTSLTSDKVGFSQYVLDNSYKCPVFWDSFSKVFRTADGNKALVRSVTSSGALNTLTDQMTIDDRGYVVYTTINNSHLTWNGYDWVNEDGSLFTKVRYVKRTIDITALNNVFSYSNVVYKIVGDIDLGGGTLTIASGSTLDFQGGSFSNGTIVGNNTTIVNTSNSYIFKENLNTTGGFILEELDIRWFGAKPDFNGTTGTDCSPAIQKALDWSQYFYGIYLGIHGKFYLETPIVTNMDLNMRGDRVPGKILFTEAAGNPNQSITSTIYVKGGITAFTLNGFGDAAKLIKFNLENIRFTAPWGISNDNSEWTGANTILISSPTIGGPSRPGSIIGCTISNFYRVLELDSSAINDEIQFYNLDIRRNSIDKCGTIFYSKTYSGRKGSGLITIENNILEQSVSAFDMSNVFGYIKICANLLENSGTSNITLANPGNLDLIGNYWEAMHGDFNITGTDFSSTVRVLQNSGGYIQATPSSTHRINLKELTLLDYDLYNMGDVVLKGVIHKTSPRVRLLDLPVTAFSQCCVNIPIQSVVYRQPSDAISTYQLITTSNIPDGLIHQPNVKSAFIPTAKFQSLGFIKGKLNDLIYISFYKNAGNMSFRVYADGGIGASTEIGTAYESGYYFIVTKINQNVGSTDVNIFIVPYNKTSNPIQISNVDVINLTSVDRKDYVIGEIAPTIIT